MLIYLYKRNLPWEYKINNIYNQYLEIMLIKETNGFGKLFEGIPKEFEEFIKYTRKLKFEQDPDYSYLRSLLNKFIINNENLTFSWIISKSRGELLGIPRHYSKKKSSPQYRILKHLKEKKKERIKRGIISDVDFNQRTSLFLSSNTSEISALKKNNTIVYSENCYLGDNNDIKKSLVIKDTERKKKIGKNHRLKIYQIY